VSYSNNSFSEDDMTSNSTLYFDYAATTPLDNEVLDAMLPFLTSEYGNANSAHHLGQRAKVIVEDAREQIASLIGAEPSEIIFTSGGTESDNAVVQGVMTLAGDKNELITSPGEHHAVLHPIELSKMKGFKPVMVPLNNDGVVEVDTLREHLSNKTCLVSLMHVNNEIGSVNDVKKLSDLCRENGILFHTDAVQSLGKIPVNVQDLGVDFLSGSAHKIYGPKGIGLMYIRNGSRWMPWLTGGSQERRRRGGTTNVPGVIGFAKALEIATRSMEQQIKTYQELNQHLLSELKNHLHACEWEINGKPGVHHITNFCFHNAEKRGIDGEMLLLNLDIEGICASNGSACTSGAVEPSHVLLALGRQAEQAKSSIRISFGKHTTKEDVSRLVHSLEAVLSRMFTLV
jgi:cysteine desulfurase